ncbi:SCO2583 family membrane protein [Streptomyces sp. SP18CS02]|uniref:SCO2583 family membrane protein n=1 Tax=Streptomyces sp. SP18CS02 TaxID=3002531 RepID=UPI002E7770E7|nr:hypothetical protein [Streptomyces sp. SP18CS02]MEE1753464.1 hypothetical protein [Streptomyces sp. SP18CS02]
MAGRGDPPEGTPEGLPGGGEDEYRSVVFDEAFVRAARLQEFSATERMGEHALAVRSRRPARSRRGPRNGALLLALMIAMAFAAAVVLGIRNPYRAPPGQRAEPLRSTVVPLAPRDVVPGGAPEDLYEHSPAARFRSGAAGITLPAARSTAHFTEGQVMTALSVVKDYLVRSSLDPDVLTGREVRSVRLLLDPDQQSQFDRSVAAPVDDGRHAATGWLVRFDTARVVPADSPVRVRGTIRVAEDDPDVLDVTSDHTFVYALRPAGKAATDGEETGASLFTVRRQLHFRFDRDDLRMGRAEVLSSQVQAGPQSCSADPSGSLRPLLAGQRATTTGPAVTDPYAEKWVPASVCGILSPNARPSP